jgi:hypothetical protein
MLLNDLLNRAVGLFSRRVIVEDQRPGQRRLISEHKVLMLFGEGVTIHRNHAITLKRGGTTTRLHTTWRYGRLSGVDRQRMIRPPS